MSDKKSPVPAKDRALSETISSKALNDVIIPNKTEIVNPLKFAFEALQKEAEAINHGNISLNLFFRDGVISRFVIDRQVSFLCNGELPQGGDK